MSGTRTGRERDRPFFEGDLSGTRKGQLTMAGISRAGLERDLNGTPRACAPVNNVSYLEGGARLRRKRCARPGLIGRTACRKSGCA